MTANGVAMPAAMPTPGRALIHAFSIVSECAARSMPTRSSGPNLATGNENGATSVVNVVSPAPLPGIGAGAADPTNVISLDPYEVRQDEKPRWASSGPADG